MKLSELKTRREAIIERELQIAVELTESKRAWFVDGIEKPIAERTTLEAEQARLALEKHHLTSKINEHKAAIKTYRFTMSHAILIKLVTERGMPDLVIEADRMALDIATAGEPA